MSEQRRSVEVSAKNVDEAVKKGLAQLGVTRDQVEVRVITEGSRGILGIGAEDARVRLTVLTPPAPPPAPRPEPRPEPARPAAPPAPEPMRPTVSAPEPARTPAAPPVSRPTPPTPEPAAPRAPAAPTHRAAPGDAGALAADTVREILGQMGLSGDIQVREAPAEDEKDDQPVYLVEVKGKDLGNLIGRRGETLDSLQYLTRLIVQHATGAWVSIIVDIEGYRARREQTLRSLAKQMAERVQRDGRSISLEPMPPFERRIVHLTLREHPAVTTMSVGEGESRKVTIRPKR